MTTRSDGPTPAGGAYSEAHLTDATGQPTDDPTEAFGVEIVEYDADGQEIARTYGRTDYPIVGVDGDNDAEDTDAKGMWDVTVSVDGIVKIVDHLDELRIVLDADVTGERVFRATIASMLTIPSWANAPQSLKDETYAWLEATRPQ